MLVVERLINDSTAGLSARRVLYSSYSYGVTITRW
jgi:hypothetical protein